MTEFKNIIPSLTESEKNILINALFREWYFKCGLCSEFKNEYVSRVKAADCFLSLIKFVVDEIFSKKEILKNNTKKDLMTAIDLMNYIGDAIISYRVADSNLPICSFNIHLCLPSDTFYKYIDDMKSIGVVFSKKSKEIEVEYGNIKFFVKKNDAI